MQPKFTLTYQDETRTVTLTNAYGFRDDKPIEVAHAYDIVPRASAVGVAVFELIRRACDDYMGVLLHMLAYAQVDDGDRFSRRKLAEGTLPEEEAFWEAFDAMERRLGEAEL